MSINLDNYVEVHDRIAAFSEKHPEGSLQSKWRVQEIGGSTLIVVEARAYRTPDDPRPGVGLASEPVPGKTPYTKDSELMNAETSAWGRAIAALGFEVRRGVASKNEVQAKTATPVETVDLISADRVNEIGRTIGRMGMTYAQIDSALQACGLPGLDGDSPKVLRARLERLSTDQALLLMEEIVKAERVESALEAVAQANG